MKQLFRKTCGYSTVAKQSGSLGKKQGERHPPGLDAVETRLNYLQYRVHPTLGLGRDVPLPAVKIGQCMQCSKLVLLDLTD